MNSMLNLKLPNDNPGSENHMEIINKVLGLSVADAVELLSDNGACNDFVELLKAIPLVDKKSSMIIVDSIRKFATEEGLPVLKSIMATSSLFTPNATNVRASFVRNEIIQIKKNSISSVQEVLDSLPKLVFSFGRQTINPPKDAAARRSHSLLNLLLANSNTPTTNTMQLPHPAPSAIFPMRLTLNPVGVAPQGNAPVVNQAILPVLGNGPVPGQINGAYQVVLQHPGTGIAPLDVQARAAQVIAAAVAGGDGVVMVRPQPTYLGQPRVQVTQEQLIALGRSMLNGRGRGVAIRTLNTIFPLLLPGQSQTATRELIHGACTGVENLLLSRRAIAGTTRTLQTRINLAHENLVAFIGQTDDLIIHQIRDFFDSQVDAQAVPLPVLAQGGEGASVAIAAPDGAIDQPQQIQRVVAAAVKPLGAVINNDQVLTGVDASPRAPISQPKTEKSKGGSNRSGRRVKGSQGADLGANCEVAPAAVKKDIEAVMQTEDDGHNANGEAAAANDQPLEQPQNGPVFTTEFLYGLWNVLYIFRPRGPASYICYEMTSHCKEFMEHTAATSENAAYQILPHNIAQDVVSHSEALKWVVWSVPYMGAGIVLVSRGMSPIMIALPIVGPVVDAATDYFQAQEPYFNPLTLAVKGVVLGSVAFGGALVSGISLPVALGASAFSVGMSVGAGALRHNIPLKSQEELGYAPYIVDAVVLGIGGIILWKTTGENSGPIFGLCGVLIGAGLVSFVPLVDVSVKQFLSYFSKEDVVRWRDYSWESSNGLVKGVKDWSSAQYHTYGVSVPSPQNYMSEHWVAYQNRVLSPQLAITPAHAISSFPTAFSSLVPQTSKENFADEYIKPQTTTSNIEIIRALVNPITLLFGLGVGAVAKSWTVINSVFFSHLSAFTQPISPNSHSMENCFLPAITGSISGTASLWSFGSLGRSVGGVIGGTYAAGKCYIGNYNSENLENSWVRGSIISTAGIVAIGVFGVSSISSFRRNAGGARALNVAPVVASTIFAKSVASVKFVLGGVSRIASFVARLATPPITAATMFAFVQEFLNTAITAFSDSKEQKAQKEHENHQQAMEHWKTSGWNHSDTAHSAGLLVNAKEMHDKVFEECDTKRLVAIAVFTQPKDVERSVNCSEIADKTVKIAEKEFYERYYVRGSGYDTGLCLVDRLAKTISHSIKDEGQFRVVYPGMDANSTKAYGYLLDLHQCAHNFNTSVACQTNVVEDAIKEKSVAFYPTEQYHNVGQLLGELGVASADINIDLKCEA